MITNHPIVDASGRFLAPPQDRLERPAGPWNENRAALRGRDVREALAGEIPVRRSALPAPFADTRTADERRADVLRRIFNEDPVSAEELAELASGRRV